MVPTLPTTLLLLATNIVTGNVESEESLTVRVDENTPTFNCNKTLATLEGILTETSQNIFNFTNGRVQLARVTIQLPGSWQTAHCAPRAALVSGQKSDRAELVVTGRPHSLVGQQPWTLQHAGCGQPGRNIELPWQFVNKNNTMEEKSSALTKEWIKLKFGVFEEEGFAGDNLYPSSFVEGKANLSNSGCLLKHQGFCDGSAVYNEDLPTKQNILCGRRSVISIIDSHLRMGGSADQAGGAEMAEISGKIRHPGSFSVAGSGQTWRSPTLQFTLPARPRMVIVLDRSSALGLNNRWSLLHSNIFRFISALPDGLELAIITFGAEAVLVLPPTLLGPTNREGVYGRVPRRHHQEETACLECGLRLASKTIPASGSSVLLITAAKTRPQNFQELLQEAGPAATQIHTLAFEESIFYEARELGQFGRTFIVHENSHDVLASAVNISDIFTTILQQAAAVPVQKFHQEQKMSDDSNTVSGNFVVEESLRRNLWVEISCPHQDDIEYFELINPTGRVFQFPKFEHGLVYFRLAGAQEPGIWSYSARLFPRAQYSRLAVQALAEPSSADWARLESWTSVDHTGVNALETPVVLYARLVRDASPVLNASVVAMVERPGGAGPVEVELRDTGTGYPDITAGDGVYSAYFTQFTSEPGFYSVVVTASNREGGAVLPRVSAQAGEAGPTRCCGSSLPFSFTVPTTTFNRHSLPGSFFVREGSQFYLRQGGSGAHRNDVYPPSRITDFSLADYLPDSLYVTLKWSAPGNDYDSGRAFRYEIRCYTSRAALREENFTDMGILVHTSLIPVPEPYSTEQRSTVGIPWPNEVFYYAIVAYDEEGNRGEVSNVVSVFAEEKPPTPPPSVQSEPTMLDSAAYPHHSASLPLTSAASTNQLIYIVSGVVSAFLVVILLIIVATLLRSRWNKQIKRSSSSQIYIRDFDSSLGGTLKKVASLPDITKANSGTRDNDSCGSDSINKCLVPSSGADLSWRYWSSSPARAAAQQAGLHRVVAAGPNEPSSTDSSMYSAHTDSEAGGSGEVVLGPGPAPRISVMEDYTVYRDLSHLDSQEYFSLSQLPRELHGLSLVPYSPGLDIVESQKRRHVSLV